MRVEILVVTYAGDAWWLRFCLESIRKYTLGFERVCVVYPRRDEAVLRDMCTKYAVDSQVFDEPPGRGHVAQNMIKCTADIYCPQATHVMHVDSDCVFTEPAIPDDYFADGKPILVRRTYDSLPPCTPGNFTASGWRKGVERALGWSEEYETMARFPIVHDIAVYPAARQRVTHVQGQPFESWVLAQKNDHPAGFSEFNVLGSVALHEFADRYALLTVPEGIEAWQAEPRPKLRQFWSHELREPTGVKQETISELASYGLTGH